jgi:hypothetical protein
LPSGPAFPRLVDHRFDGLQRIGRNTHVMEDHAIADR